MDLQGFRTEMEDSVTWRKLEYMALRNLLKDQNDNIPIIKTLVVMLYAHFEGFFKDCLELYIQFLNSTNQELNKYTEYIVAASLHKMFNSYEDTNRKCKIFKNAAPSEDYLHRFYRRKEITTLFTENFLQQKIKIANDLINTKSNLMYDVLQENFYKFGLDFHKFDEKSTFINKLVNLRNNVAHGSQKQPIDFTEFEKIESNVFDIMEQLIIYLYDEAKDGKYYKETS